MSKNSGFFHRINWTNTLFLIITPLLGIIGTVALALMGSIHWATVGLAVVMGVLTGVGVTGGYHRLFAHRTYQVVWPVRLFYLLFGAAAFEGSALEWCTDHRDHHRYTDTDKDPYDIKKGFWFAHIGWLLLLDRSRRDFANVQDLHDDPLIRFQHRHFVWLGFLMGFGFPTLLASLWGDPLGGLIIAGSLRIAITHHMTFCINSVCHLFGKRTYSEKQSARDNWVTALFTFGEGFHNFHHQFPGDYRNGIRAYHFDPTKWLIFMMSKAGMAKELKRIGEHRIIKYRLRVEHNQLMQPALQSAGEFLGHLIDSLKPLHDKLISLIATIEELEKRYEIHGHLREYQIQLKTAKQELRRLFAVWVKVAKNPACYYQQNMRVHSS